MIIILLIKLNLKLYLPNVSKLFFDILLNIFKTNIIYYILLILLSLMYENYEYIV